MIDGITTAAAVFATAAIGAAAGAGLLAVAALATAWSSSPWKDRTRITAISDGAEQPAGIPARTNWERKAVPAQNTH